MKTSDIIKIGTGVFAVLNLGYIGYALVKNHKDYKNQTGEYKPEEPVEEQLNLFDTSECDEDELMEEIDNVVIHPNTVKLKRKYKIKKSVWIGVGLVCGGIIGVYCYGFRSGYNRCKVNADEVINSCNDVIASKENIINTLESRIENYEVEREKITSNALDMLLPGYMETRWITVNKKGNANNNYTPKVTKDLSADDILEKMNDMWSKLYEPVVVVPEVEEV
nr:MAG TPA: hypothetical protein [Caudoviricetes sp.]